MILRRLKRLWKLSEPNYYESSKELSQIPKVSKMIMNNVTSDFTYMDKQAKFIPRISQKPIDKINNLENES